MFELSSDNPDGVPMVEVIDVCVKVESSFPALLAVVGRSCTPTSLLVLLAPALATMIRPLVTVCTATPERTLFDK